MRHQIRERRWGRCSMAQLPDTSTVAPLAPTARYTSSRYSRHRHTHDLIAKHVRPASMAYSARYRRWLENKYASMWCYTRCRCSVRVKFSHPPFIAVIYTNLVCSVATRRRNRSINPITRSGLSDIRGEKRRKHEIYLDYSIGIPKQGRPRMIRGHATGVEGRR